MLSLQIPCPQCGKELRIPDRRLLGRKGKCPKCGHTFVLTEPEAVVLEPVESPGSAMNAAVPPTDVTVEPPPFVPEFQPTDTPSGGVARLKEIRRRNAKRRRIGFAVGTVILLAVGGVGYAIYLNQPPAAATVPTVAPVPSVKNAAEELPPEEVVATSPSPTAGEPISLAFIPSGARIVIHLRPAELWQPNSRGEEFRYCLGPLGEWVGRELQELAKRDPAQIDEALICLIPGARGTPPELAAVLRLTTEAKRSDLIEQFAGEAREFAGQLVQVSAGRALWIYDLKTLVFGPERYAEEMVRSAQTPNPTAPGIEELLPLTDRQRHITVLFDPTSVRIDRDFLVPETVRPFLTVFLDWFGRDVETVAWSLHLGSDEFFSELLLRNQLTIRPVELQQKMVAKLDGLPHAILEAVQKMNPRERGKRTIIGRFPAMTKVFALTTTAETGPRHVRLATALPERAAPNLALGTLLTWDESTRTDFSKPVPTPSTDPKQPESLADRLKTRIDVDFRRTPLEEAFAYLFDEAKVPFEIDGEALKLSGYTKNMPQTFKLDQVPATDALSTILKQYNQMCVVLDEPKNRALVTTLPVAEQQGLKAFLPK